MPRELTNMVKKELREIFRDPRLFLGVVLVPILAIIYLSLARVFLETVTVLFKVKDDVHRIAERKP